MNTNQNPTAPVTPAASTQPRSRVIDEDERIRLQRVIREAEALLNGTPGPEAKIGYTVPIEEKASPVMHGPLAGKLRNGLLRLIWMMSPASGVELRRSRDTKASLLSSARELETASGEKLLDISSLRLPEIRKVLLLQLARLEGFTEHAVKSHGSDGIYPDLGKFWELVWRSGLFDGPQTWEGSIGDLKAWLTNPQNALSLRERGQANYDIAFVGSLVSLSYRVMPMGFIRYTRPSEYDADKFRWLWQIDARCCSAAAVCDVH